MAGRRLRWRRLIGISPEFPEVGVRKIRYVLVHAPSWRASQWHVGGALLSAEAIVESGLVRAHRTYFLLRMTTKDRLILEIG